MKKLILTLTAELSVMLLAFSVSEAVAHPVSSSVAEYDDVEIVVMEPDGSGTVFPVTVDLL